MGKGTKMKFKFIELTMILEDLEESKIWVRVDNIHEIVPLPAGSMVHTVCGDYHEKFRIAQTPEMLLDLMTF